jgi:hypothetical protein
MAAAKSIDWEVVHLEYRANLLSIRQIADRHGITDGAIRKRAKRDGWVRDLSQEIRETAEDMIRQGEVLNSASVRTGLRTVPERTAVLAAATSIADQKWKTRRQLDQAQAVFDDLIEELGASTANIEQMKSLGETMRSPDEFGRDALHDAFTKAISLPSRVSMFKTATDAMRNMQAVSRLEFGMDAKTSPIDENAPKLTPTQTVARIAFILHRAGLSIAGEVT